jgi:hypothetical protein
MVQSDLPIGRTKSGKINAKWYLDRLKSSNIYHSNKRHSNSSINTHKVYLTSPNQQVCLFFIIIILNKHIKIESSFKFNKIKFNNK